MTATPEEIWEGLTPGMRRALLRCLVDTRRILSRRTVDSDRLPVIECDARSRGALIERDLLGWADGWVDLVVLLPLGRATAEYGEAVQP